MDPETRQASMEDRPLELREVPTPHPEADQVRLRRGEVDAANIVVRISALRRPPEPDGPVPAPVPSPLPGR